MSKTILITGANSGIGLAAACELARRGHHIIAWCRNRSKGEAALSQIQNAHPEGKGELILADLGDLQGVRHAADTLRDHHPRIDVLLNNAGYYPPEVRYVDGVEESLLASHLGHMLLSLRLLPLLEASGEGRIVNVSSAAHAVARAERLFNPPDKYSATQVYADVKLANILLSLGLKRHIAGPVTAFSLHPGMVNTHFGDNVSGLFGLMVNLITPFMLSPAKGARTSIHLAIAPIERLRSHNGGYFSDSKPRRLKHRDATDARAEWLWDRSMEQLQPYL